MPPPRVCVSNVQGPYLPCGPSARDLNLSEKKRPPASVSSPNAFQARSRQGTASPQQSIRLINVGAWHCTMPYNARVAAVSNRKISEITSTVRAHRKMRVRPCGTMNTKFGDIRGRATTSPVLYEIESVRTEKIIWCNSQT